MKIRAEPRGSFILQKIAPAQYRRKEERTVKNKINVLKNLRGG